MKLSDILIQQAKYTTDSGYSVEIDTALPCVSIIDNCGNTVVFLQGEEAQQFIDECDKTWNKVGTLSQQVVLDAFAAQYIDIL